MLSLLDPPSPGSIREAAAALYVGLVLELWLASDGDTLSAAAHRVIAKHAAQLRREAAWQHETVTSVPTTPNASPPST